MSRRSHQQQQQQRSHPLRITREEEFRLIAEGNYPSNNRNSANSRRRRPTSLPINSPPDLPIDNPPATATSAGSSSSTIGNTSDQEHEFDSDIAPHVPPDLSIHNPPAAGTSAGSSPVLAIEESSSDVEVLDPSLDNIPTALATTAESSSPPSSDFPTDLGTTAAPGNGEFSISNILAKMNQDDHIFGEDTLNIRNLSMNNKEYEHRKFGIVKRFFAILASRPSTSALAEIIPDPDDKPHKKERFFITIRRAKTPQKRKMFQQCILLFSSRLVLIKYRDKPSFTTQLAFATAQYQPNVVGTMMRTLFSHFHKNDIQFSQSKDFNGQGTLIFYYQ